MKRPRIHPRKSKLHKTSEWLAGLFVPLSFLLIISAFKYLPEAIPIYFNWPSKDENGMGHKELL